MQRLIFTLLLVAGLAANAVASEQRDLQRAQKSLAKNDFAAAYKQFADIDHPLAFFSLGLMEELGMGRPAKRNAACRWYAKSAEGKIPTGIMRHAECLADGVLGEPDFAESARWYQEAIDLGNPVAACELGKLHMEGKGVERDPDKALALCQQAAQTGVVPAMLQLADWYSDHDMPLHDHQLALQWYQAAANKDAPEALHALGMMIFNNHVEQLKPTDSLPLLERAASQGYAASYLPVAASYWHKRSEAFPDSPPPDDLAKAYLWAGAAAQAGDSEQVRIDGKTLLAEINTLMPAEWKPSLDEKLKTHLQKHHEAGGE